MANHGLMFREQSTDLNVPLPPGWSRHVYRPAQSLEEYGPSVEDLILTPGNGAHYYTQICNPSEKFWHPVPICDSDATPAIPPAHQYISCRTKRTTITKFELRESEDAVDSYIIVQSNKGMIVGAVWPDELSPMGAFDLICLSKGMRSYQSLRWRMDWEEDVMPQTELMCTYYHVLWIVWNDEHTVARREGVGWVLKDEWDKLETTWTDIVLD